MVSLALFTANYIGGVKSCEKRYLLKLFTTTKILKEKIFNSFQILHPPGTVPGTP